MYLFDGTCSAICALVLSGCAEVGTPVARPPAAPPVAVRSTTRGVPETYDASASAVELARQGRSTNDDVVEAETVVTGVTPAPRTAGTDDRLELNRDPTQVSAKGRPGISKPFPPPQVGEAGLYDLVRLGPAGPEGAQCLVSTAIPERLLTTVGRLVPAGVWRDDFIRAFATFDGGTRPVFSIILKASKTASLDDETSMFVAGLFDAERAAVCARTGEGKGTLFFALTNNFLHNLHWSNVAEKRLSELQIAWFRIHNQEYLRRSIKYPWSETPVTARWMTDADVSVGFDWMATLTTEEGHDRVVNRTLLASPGSKVSDLRDSELVEEGDATGVLTLATWRVGSLKPDVELALERTASVKYELSLLSSAGRRASSFSTQQDLVGPLVRDERLHSVRFAKGPFDFELLEFRPEISSGHAVVVHYSRGANDELEDLTLSAGGGQTLRLKMSNEGRFDSGGPANNPDFQFATAFRIGSNGIGSTSGPRLSPELAERKRRARNK